MKSFTELLLAPLPRFGYFRWNLEERTTRPALHGRRRVPGHDSVRPGLDQALRSQVEAALVRAVDARDHRVALGDHMALVHESDLNSLARDEGAQVAHRARPVPDPELALADALRLDAQMGRRRAAFAGASDARRLSSAGAGTGGPSVRRARSRAASRARWPGPPPRRDRSPPAMHSAILVMRSGEFRCQGTSLARQRPHRDHEERRRLRRPARRCGGRSEGRPGRWPSPA